MRVWAETKTFIYLFIITSYTEYMTHYTITQCTHITQTQNKRIKAELTSCYPVYNA